MSRLVEADAQAILMHGKVSGFEAMAQMHMDEDWHLTFWSGEYSEDNPQFALEWLKTFGIGREHDGHYAMVGKGTDGERHVALTLPAALALLEDAIELAKQLEG